MQISSWNFYTLEELSDNFDALRIPVKGTNRIKGIYPYYGASGIIDLVDNFIFEGDYLLVAEDGENLRSRKTPIAFIASGKFWVNNHAHIIRGNQKADTKFLMYQISQTNISGYLSGSTIPKLTQDNLNRLPIFAPSLPEQRTIADVLSALDDKIELNLRINSTLEQLTQSLFNYFFIDNPESANWKTGTLSDLCQIALGGDWGADISQGDDQLVICLRGVDLEYLRKEGYSPNAPLRWVKKSSFTKRKMTDCDVLIAGSGIGPIGRPIWVSNSMLSVYDQEIIYSNFCKRLTAKSPGYALFIDRVFHNLHQSKEILDFVNGTSLPNLDINGLVNKYQMLIPPEHLIDKYLEIVEPFNSFLYSRESRTLAELRDTLLPKLMSGQVQVKDIKSENG